MSTVGSLGINFETNAAEIINDFQKITNSVGRAEGAISKSLAGISSMAKMAAGALAGVFSVEAIKGAFEYAASLNDIKSQTGFAIDVIQEMETAGLKNTVSVEKMNDALGKFNRTIGDVANHVKEPTDLFKRMGVSIYDASGNILPSEQILYRVSDALARFENPAVRASVAARIFGKDAGPAMAVMLGQGSAALRKYMLDAKDTAGVLDNDLAEKASMAADDMAVLGRSIVTNFNSGVLTELQGHFGDAAAATKNFGTAAHSAGEVLGYVAAHAIEVAGLIWDIIKPVAGLVGGFDGLVAAAKTAVDIITVSFINLKLIVLGAESMIIGSLQSMEDGFAELYSRLHVEYKRSTLLSGLAADIARDTEDAKKALAKGLADIEKNGGDFVSAVKKKLAEVGTESPSIKPPKLDALNNNGYNAAGGSLKGLGDSTEDLQKKLDRFRDRSVNTLVDDLGQLATGALKGKDAFKSFAVSVVGDLNKMLLEATVKPWFQSLFSGGTTGGTGLSGLVSGLGGIGSGIMSGLGSVGSSLASGFSHLLGFKTGGSFEVGGSGGTDSQLVAFKASPNETVSITKPGQEASGGGHQFFIDARGADSAAVARLEGVVRALHGSIERRALSAVFGEMRRNPGFAG